MKNTKLIQLLRTFSPAEIIEFGKFINSPYHNESQKIIKLYSFLRKFHPDFDDKKFTKENAYSSVYGNEKYDDKKLRDRFSDIFRIAEEYLAIQTFKKREIEFNRYTLNQFTLRNLNVHFNKKYADIQKILDKTDFQNENYFEASFLVFDDKLSFDESQHLLGKRKPFFENITIIFELYLRYVVAKLLRFYAIMQNVEGLVNYKYDYKLYDPILKFAEENSFDSVLIKALCLILKLHKENEYSVYFELKKLYSENSHLFSHYDNIMISTELFNRSKTAYVEGREEFEKEVFEIILLQIENKTYNMEKGMMKREYYMYCVQSAILLKKYSWTEKFIEEYISKLLPDVRENTYLYVTAELQFAQKKYNSALENLAKINLTDFIYYVNVKRLLCLIYFELNEYEQVLFIVDTFKHYLASNSVMPERTKKVYINFVEMMYKLVQISYNQDEYKIEMLINELQKLSHLEIVRKKWLTEKAQGLFSKRK